MRDDSVERSSQESPECDQTSGAKSAGASEGATVIPNAAGGSAAASGLASSATPALITMSAHEEFSSGAHESQLIGAPGVQQDSPAAGAGSTAKCPAGPMHIAHPAGGRNEQSINRVSASLAALVKVFMANQDADAARLRQASRVARRF